MEMVKLIGAVTEGDIKRYFENMEKTSFHDLVNTNIKYIIYSNEEQVYEDAGIIFNMNEKINNIPVVDKAGNLLFQIDRYEKSKNELYAINNILEACANASMEFFLLGGIKEVIITGGNLSSLMTANRIILKNYKTLIETKNINIKIIEDFNESYIIGDKTRIISLSQFGFMYWYNVKKFKIDIITAYELVSFCELKNIYNIEKETISVFMNIFKYKAVAFYPINKNIYEFIELLKTYGLKIYNLHNEFLNNRNRFRDINSVFDIFLVSGNEEEYIEKISVTVLILLIKYIKRYRQLTGEFLEYNIFMKKCLTYISDMQKRGFTGFLHIPSSLWGAELNNNIKNKNNFEVITKWEEMKPKGRYFIDEDSFHKQKPGSKTMSAKICFLKYICENSLYNYIKTKCKNVYICSDFLYDDATCKNQIKSERNRGNFLSNVDLFSENFINTICGDDKEYLYKVIQDRAGCNIVKLNDFHYKFSSNYHSTFFNTDLYGNRVVNNIPNEYTRTIYLVGKCIFSGYAVEDKHTIASYLQSFINVSGYKYKVENLSYDSIEPVLNNRLLERNINTEDIVVIQTKAFFQAHEMIPIDFDDINNYMEGNIWFWDVPVHMGNSGYKFMAEKIYDAIEPVMTKSKDAFVYKFHLENNLECEIEKYINSSKRILNKNNFYSTLYMQKNTNSNKSEIKAGAVIMNCNPFTYGHQYLIDTASRMVDVLYVFVVEEDKSIFSFKERFAMVKDGISKYKNVIVIPSGKFMISSVTFPGYFMKNTPTGNSYDDFIDLKIFAHYIAPAFQISKRFVGEEPFDKVTAQYNKDMKIILKEAGITVIEIPRKKYGNEFISATKVRKLLEEKNYTALKNYLPNSSIRRLNIW